MLKSLILIFKLITFSWLHINPNTFTIYMEQARIYQSWKWKALSNLYLNKGCIKVATDYQI